MDERGEMVVDPAMGRVLEALDEGYVVDLDDLVHVLSQAEVAELAERGKEWLLIALWQAEYGRSSQRARIDQANARADKAEARVRELQSQLQPLISRNRALNNALLTLRHALQISAIGEDE